ncbi:MarR family transcriptional regulator [uncultured Streptomyces sp.]|uniref:MarR family transcriptional regulator n=1 Tax=uncultured Streptomyces sp. TaxID=174707 RepID=UPI00263949F7|nr:MarR family transcriptional regulator [uncultured Streptomyces sp.]
MANQHLNSALPAPAASRPYRKAHPGYGKQSIPGQGSSHRADFALLPERERYVAAYVDRLPEGAAMDIKSLAKDLPLYGQMAIGTALRALAVAGHLRRVRCRVEGHGPCRWVTLTYWSRAAHDNEWWTARLTGGAAAPDQTPPAPSVRPAVPQQRAAPTDIMVFPAPNPPQPPPIPDLAASSANPWPPSPVPVPDLAASANPSQPSAFPSSSLAPDRVPGADAPYLAEAPSPAYLALAELGRRDSRLALSAADCAVLEPLAAAWFTRGASAQYLASALTAGLPEQVGSPVGLVRRRLNDKMPPRLPASPPATTPTDLPGAPVRRLLVECTECGRPGPAAALPDGLCAPCRTVRQAPEPADDATAPEPGERDVAARVADLRNLMRTP